MTAPGTFSDSWERYLSYNIESLNDHDKLLLYGVLSPNESQAIREKFIKLKDKQFQLGLVHGDLSLENIIVENDSVTLIDWGNAESTIIPHMEIIALLQNKMSDTDPLFDAFLRGYKLDRGVYESIKSDIQTLTLLQAIDKLRWAFDKKQEKIEEFSQRVKSLL
jgi:RIO-like serine/threonine protein kinase